MALQGVVPSQLHGGCLLAEICQCCDAAGDRAGQCDSYKRERDWCVRLNQLLQQMLLDPRATSGLTNSLARLLPGCLCKLPGSVSVVNEVSLRGGLQRSLTQIHTCSEKGFVNSCVVPHPLSDICAGNVHFSPTGSLEYFSFLIFYIVWIF